MAQIVYFFDEPTIGYCKECDHVATWDNAKGLHCPICGSDELSLFVWDENTPYPE